MECAAQHLETTPDFIAEEVRRIEEAQYQDWLLSLEQAGEDVEQAEIDDAMWDIDIDWDDDEYDDRDYDYDPYRDDTDRFDEFYDASDLHHAYDSCEHCKVLDAIRAIGGLESHLSYPERRMLTLMAMRLTQLWRTLRERKSQAHR